MLNPVFHHGLARSRLLEHLLPQFSPLRLRLLPLLPLCLNGRIPLLLSLFNLCAFLLILFIQALCGALLPFVMRLRLMLCIITTILQIKITSR